MSNMSEDIQYAGPVTRQTNADRTDFLILATTHSLYCLGKSNGEDEKIMKSITEGPFQNGNVIQNSAEECWKKLGCTSIGNQATVQDGRVVVQDVRGRYNANNQGRPFQHGELTRFGGELLVHGGLHRVVASWLENNSRRVDQVHFKWGRSYKLAEDAEETEGALQLGIPKDIYTLINHYTDAKDIWDNVKMILEGSELTKDDRESQLYDEFERFCQIKGETIHVYYVRFSKLINDMRNIKMTMSRMQLNSKFVNNMLPEWSRFITEVKLNRGLKESNFDQLYASLKQQQVLQKGKEVLSK
ncbi:hypothetical protein Tco_0726410 [Tanacetum coccineum]|uniref:Zinc finger, CCHC-type n=1 Tax=Tanacetum coccineum TaxID=301880 RepID=A0ABQ4YFI5_9ASTR